MARCAIPLDVGVGDSVGTAQVIGPMLVKPDPDGDKDRTVQARDIADKVEIVRIARLLPDVSRVFDHQAKVGHDEVVVIRMIDSEMAMGGLACPDVCIDKLGSQPPIDFSSFQQSDADGLVSHRSPGAGRSIDCAYCRLCSSN